MLSTASTERRAQALTQATHRAHPIWVVNGNTQSPFYLGGAWTCPKIRAKIAQTTRTVRTVIQPGAPPCSLRSTLHKEFKQSSMIAFPTDTDTLTRMRTRTHAHTQTRARAHTHTHTHTHAHNRSCRRRWKMYTVHVNTISHAYLYIGHVHTQPVMQKTPGNTCALSVGVCF